MQALHAYWLVIGGHGSTQSNPPTNPLKSGVMRNVSKWCGWRGSNPRPLASEGRTFHWTVVSVSQDFQVFCGGTEWCLSGFRKTHWSTQQHISLLNQTLSELQDVVVRSHILRYLCLNLFETQLFVWFVLLRIHWWNCQWAVVTRTRCLIGSHTNWTAPLKN